MPHPVPFRLVPSFLLCIAPRLTQHSPLPIFRRVCSLVTILSWLGYGVPLANELSATFLSWCWASRPLFCLQCLSLPNSAVPGKLDPEIILWFFFNLRNRAPGLLLSFQPSARTFFQSLSPDSYSSPIFCLRNCALPPPEGAPPEKSFFPSGHIHF